MQLSNTAPGLECCIHCSTYTPYHCICWSVYTIQCCIRYYITSSRLRSINFYKKNPTPCLSCRNCFIALLNFFEREGMIFFSPHLSHIPAESLWFWGPIHLQRVAPLPSSTRSRSVLGHQLNRMDIKIFPPSTELDWMQSAVRASERNAPTRSQVFVHSGREILNKWCGRASDNS